MAADWAGIFVNGTSALAAIASAMAAIWALRISRQAYEWQVRSDAPRIQVSVRQHPHRRTLILLVIENVGGSIAYDVKFSLSRSLPQRAYGLGNVDPSKIEEMKHGPLVTGIPALAPSDTRVLQWGQYAGLHAYLGDAFAKVEAVFLDESGATHKSLSVLEVKSFEFNDASENDPLSRMERSLEGLANHAKRLGTPSGPLAVETPAMYARRMARRRELIDNKTCKEPVMRLSPTAEAVLADHRAHPDDSFYDLSLLGSMFKPEDVERLDAAYRELEEATLVRRSGGFVNFFGTPKPLYTLADANGVKAEVA